MRFFKRAALAAMLTLSLLTPAFAIDRVQWLYGANPPSSWWNFWQRDERLGIGTWWATVVGNTNGFYYNLTVNPATGLYVTVAPTNSNSLGAIYQYLPEESNPFGGPGVTALPVDSTQVFLQGLISTTSSTIGPLSAPTTSGQSIDYLIECQVQTIDTTPQTLTFVTTTGQQTLGTGNRDRKDIGTCQSKAGTAATTGSQTVPSADSGWVGIGYTAVAYGATSISSVTMYPSFGGFAQLNSSGVISPSQGGTGTTSIPNAACLGYTGSAFTAPSCAILSVANTWTAAQTFSVAPVGPNGGTFLDTSSTAQTKSGGLTAGSLTSNGGVAVGGAVSGATSIAFSSAGSLGSTVVGCENDGAGTAGLVCNVPSGSTNGYRFQVAGTTKASISAAGLLTAAGVTSTAGVAVGGTLTGITSSTFGSNGTQTMPGTSALLSIGTASSDFSSNTYGLQLMSAYSANGTHFFTSAATTVSGVTGSALAIAIPSANNYLTLEAATGNLGILGSLKTGSSTYGATSATVAGAITSSTTAGFNISAAASSGYQYVTTAGGSNSTSIGPSSQSVEGFTGSVLTVTGSGLNYMLTIDPSGDMGVLGKLSSGGNFTSSGYVVAGYGAGSTNLTSGDVDAGRTNQAGLISMGGSTSAGQLDWNISTTNVLSIKTEAGAYANVYGGTYTPSSDRRWKHDIHDTAHGLSDIMRMRPRDFRWNSDDRADTGFIAQEAKGVLPELVSRDGKGFYGFEYANLTAVLTRAVQEQQHEIDAIVGSKKQGRDAQIAALQNQIDALYAVIGLIVMYLVSVRVRARR